MKPPRFHHEAFAKMQAALNNNNSQKALALYLEYLHECGVISPSREVIVRLIQTVISERERNERKANTRR